MLFREFKVSKEGKRVPVSSRFAEDLAAVKQGLQRLIETDLEDIEQQLDAAGAPWSPGRQIPE